MQLRWTGPIDPNSPTLGLPRLDGVRTTLLYRATPETGTYSHHGYITSHSGVLVAAWSNHAADEDAPGQHVLFSRSTDCGGTWERWNELFPPHDEMKPAEQQDWNADRVLIANGFAEVDGKLYAIAEAHVLDERRGLGRLARSIEPDGSLGEVFCLIDSPPEPVAGFPRYPAASESAAPATAARINDCLARPENLPSWEFLGGTCSPIADDGHKMCEPTQSWRLFDGRYVRLYRDLGTPGAQKPDRSGRNYAQFSFDDARTWTPPSRADFPDACSRSAAGTLPDGTVYIINNPGNSRDPLVISLSADGLNFDRHAIIASGAAPRRHEGRWKDRGFAYPRAAVQGDTLFVVYSICKEDVAVAAVPISALRG